MTADLGPAATPRPIPTREDRMSTDDRIPDRCHTVDEHHRMAGDTADTRSQDRAIRELTAERDKARRERDSLACRLAIRFEETEKLRAGLAAAQRTIAAQAAQIRANGTLLARLHDLAEQADRAWADHDTTAPGSPADRAQEAIRPPAWEQQAIDAAAAGLGDAWSVLATDPTSGRRLATAAVRAIIDAGLAGDGGRCPQCGTRYPRTMPAGEDQRCWTCATEEVAGLDEYADRAQDERGQR